MFHLDPDPHHFNIHLRIGNKIVALIQFTRNYKDLSTDRGYQFKFDCDKCGNGHMTQYQASALGIAQSMLNVAGGLFSWGYRAGNAAYEVQRAIGGKAHDAALAEAVEEARPNFKQCTTCGKWVCQQVCWNPSAQLCEDCAPNLQEHLAKSQAEAKQQAMHQQMLDRARQTDYVSHIDLAANTQIAATTAATNLQPSKILCGECGADVGTSKFCPECGTKVVSRAEQVCTKCGFKSPPNTKFCGDCGNKF
jgi:hypothetical protein